MMQDPSIDDRMTANGYVRCGGCGGYLPAGAICGLCLQKQQQQMAIPMPRPKAAAKPARPLKTGLAIVVCAILAGGVGLASLMVIRTVGKAGHLGGSNATSALASLTGAGNGGSDILSSQSNQKVISALSSGDTQQALAALQASGSPPPALMQEASAPQNPVMQAPQTQATPTMEAGKGMPDDVRNWLEHLRKVEEARIALAAAQLQESVKTLAGLQAGDIGHAMDDGGDDSVAAEKKKENDRAQRVGGDMATMQMAWKTLLSAFDSVQTPAECMGIKSNYDQVIGQTGTMIIQIVGQIKAAGNDPQAAVAALTAMQGTSKSKIDVPARAADQGVGNVCKKYDTVKWFDIESDVGSGTMSQLGF